MSLSNIGKYNETVFSYIMCGSLNFYRPFLQSI